MSGYSLPNYQRMKSPNTNDDANGLPEEKEDYSYSNDELLSNPAKRSRSSRPDIFIDTPSIISYMKMLSEEPILTKQDFLYKLAVALYSYGCPAHRIESNLLMSSDCLRINGTFVILPSLIIITLGEQDCHSSSTHILKTNAGYDMYRLQQVEDLVSDFLQGKYLNWKLENFIGRLVEIKQAPEMYSYPFKVASYGLFSAVSAPLLFNGGWLDAIASFILGSIVGALIELSSKVSSLTSVLEILVSIGVSFSARALSLAYPDSICYWSVALSGVVWLLPGLSITCAIMEMSTRNIISGTVHMFYSFVLALMLGFGLALGLRLVIWADEPLNHSCQSVSAYWGIVLFPILNICINILLNSSYKQWAPMLLISGAGYIVYYYLSRTLSVELASVIASFVIGVGSYANRHWANQIAIAPILSGITILVPGSLGVKGVSAFFDNDANNGTRFGFDMIILALSISVGLFTSNFLVNPSTMKKTDRYQTF